MANNHEYTLGDIAEQIGAQLFGDASTVIHGIGTLEKAGQGEISFLSNRRYAGLLKNTGATAVILNADDQPICPVDSLVVENPYLAFALASRLLYPDKDIIPGIDPSVSYDQTAQIHPDSYIGPHVTIGAGSVILAGVYIGAGCTIGNNVKIGTDTRISPNVVMYDDVQIGERCILHSGVVIGADGFGIANDKGRWVKIPQVGSVIIGNDVEIGANTTIDRGALENTIVADGVKIDNQVQIGHNVHIGTDTAIAGCVAIAGSTYIGKRCMIGGACGISGHIEICDDVVLMGMTGVANSIKEPGVYGSGIPAMDVKLWRKNIAVFKQLFMLNSRVRKIEKNS